MKKECFTFVTWAYLCKKRHFPRERERKGLDTSPRYRDLSVYSCHVSSEQGTNLYHTFMSHRDSFRAKQETQDSQEVTISWLTVHEDISHFVFPLVIQSILTRF